jgi:4-alpha-glucanotransferase
MELQTYCDTQRKIDRLIGGLTDNDSLLIRDGLFKIANEVLFLEDPYELNKYHPRIIASRSYAFRALTEDQQQAFQKLSDDFFYHRHN